MSSQTNDAASVGCIGIVPASKRRKLIAGNQKGPLPESGRGFGKQIRCSILQLLGILVPFANAVGQRFS